MSNSTTYYSIREQSESTCSTPPHTKCTTSSVFRPAESISDKYAPEVSYQHKLSQFPTTTKRRVGMSKPTFEFLEQKNLEEDSTKLSPIQTPRSRSSCIQQLDLLKQILSSRENECGSPSQGLEIADRAKGLPKLASAITVYKDGDDQGRGNLKDTLLNAEIKSPLIIDFRSYQHITRANRSQSNSIRSIMVTKQSKSKSRVKPSFTSQKKVSFSKNIMTLYFNKDTNL